MLRKITSLIGLVALVGCNANQAGPIVTPASSPTVAPATDSKAFQGFSDTFDGPELDATKWISIARAGLMLMKDGRLDLLTPGEVGSFPFLVTKRDIFPESGPFYFEFDYTIMTRGRRDFALALDYLPPLNDTFDAITTPMLLVTGNQSNHDQIFSLNTELGKSTYTATDALKSGSSHRLRLEFDGVDKYRLILDKTELGRFTSKRIPRRFWLSGYPFTEGSPVVWTRVQLDQVSTGILTTPAEAAPTPPPSAPAAK